MKEILVLGLGKVGSLVGTLLSKNFFGNRNRSKGTTLQLQTSL